MGHEKSSGTFVSLFESRLIRAKRYLDDPFEISIDINNGASGSQKVTISTPINVSLTSSWEEFDQGQRNGLILNGDGQSLPIPSNTVDSVITDPQAFGKHFGEKGRMVDKDFVSQDSAAVTMRTIIGFIWEYSATSNYIETFTTYNQRERERVERDVLRGSRRLWRTRQG